VGAGHAVEGIETLEHAHIGYSPVCTEMDELFGEAPGPIPQDDDDDEDDDEENQAAQQRAVEPPEPRRPLRRSISSHPRFQSEEEIIARRAAKEGQR
jgi:hypothetical protein